MEKQKNHIESKIVNIQKTSKEKNYINLPYQSCHISVFTYIYIPRRTFTTCHRNRKQSANPPLCRPFSTLA